MFSVAIMLKQFTEGPEMCRIWFKVRGRREMYEEDFFILTAVGY